MPKKKNKKEKAISFFNFFKKEMPSVPSTGPLSFVLESGKTILVETRVSARTNRLRLRWSNEHSLFFLTHPPFVGEGDIWRFLTEHRSWIQETLEKIPQSITIEIGHAFSFFGQSWRLSQDVLRKRGIWKQGTDLIVGQGVIDLKKTIENTLKQEAFLFFESWSRHYALQLGTTFTRISIRDGRSRWGSCSPSGTLSYSWRLGLAPLEVAKYVCAHEVAHLKEMNHSARFWALVQQLDPSYKKHRAWLKKEGRGLKNISFG